MWLLFCFRNSVSRILCVAGHFKKISWITNTACREELADGILRPETLFPRDRRLNDLDLMFDVSSSYVKSKETLIGVRQISFYFWGVKGAMGAATVQKWGSRWVSYKEICEVGVGEGRLNSIWWMGGVDEDREFAKWVTHLPSRVKVRGSFTFFCGGRVLGVRLCFHRSPGEGAVWMINGCLVCYRLAIITITVGDTFGVDYLLVGLFLNRIK